MKVSHNLKPIYNKDSKILILGTIPSVKSRELSFYYMHPQNRFWKVLSIIFKEEIKDDIRSKEEFLYRNKIALWDTLKSCEIDGSSDSSINNIEINDIKSIINNSNTKYIYTTGKKAYDIYQKYIFKDTNIKAIYLPSTSAANASYSLEKLVDKYKKIKP